MCVHPRMSPLTIVNMYLFVQPAKLVLYFIKLATMFTTWKFPICSTDKENIRF